MGPGFLEILPPERTGKTEMGRHGHHDRGHHSGYDRRDYRDPRMAGGSADYGMPPRLPRKLRMAVVLVGLVLWSLLAWMAYALVDPVLAWVAGSGGLLVDGGKGLATVTGAGKEVGSVLDNLNASGFWGQAIALLRVVLKPAVIILWALGALALIAAPVILPRISRLLGRRRH